MNLKGLATTLVSVVMMAVMSSLAGCQCVYDDLSHCQSNKLIFSYLADGSKEVLPDYIKDIYVYIYSADGRTLIRKIHMDDFKGEPNPSLILTLPKGDYHVVAVGNVHDQTKIEGEENLNSARIGEPGAFDRNTKVLEGTDRLYLVDKMITSNPGGTVREDRLSFKSGHIRMHFQVTDLPDQYAGVDQPFIIRMKPMPRKVGMNGSVDSGDRLPIELIPTLGQYGDRQVLGGDFNTLRFSDDNDIVLQLLSKDGSLLIETSLKQFMKDYKITVNDRQEVDIYVRFYFRGLVVHVKPWIAVDTTPITE